MNKFMQRILGARPVADSLEEQAPTTDRSPSTDPSGGRRRDRRRRSSLRVIVEEVRMLFGLQATQNERLARHVVVLRKRSHETNNNLTHISAKLDTLLRERGLPIPAKPMDETPEELEDDGAPDARRG